ncbi:MAG: HesA/MoeB/ThiF family protein [Flavobacteriales bacterium]|nr:HesA/MoeB/ThiF family protein [Flavobacteriales bacterium]
MKITPKNLYQRQTILPEIGELGQQKLREAKIVIVGCGGLGSVAAVYLAASGVGNIHLIDFDVVSVSNLHRQVFYTTKSIGKPKVEVLSKHIKSVAPFVKITHSTTALSKLNTLEAFADFDIILDCTDSLPIKYLINDACVLTDKILVYGSLYKFDGYVASFNVSDTNGEHSCNLRDAFPEMPKEYIPNCAEAGTLNSIVGLIGLMQANEVLKLITQTGKPLINQLLIYNSLENTQFKMKLKSLDFYHSERKRRISNIFKTETYTDTPCDLQDENLLISATDLKEQLLKSRENLCLISVIENQNTLLPFEVDAKIPLSKFNPKNLKIDQSKTYVMVCQIGITSYTATKTLKKEFPDLKVLSLQDGIEKY